MSMTDLSLYPILINHWIDSWLSVYPMVYVHNFEISMLKFMLVNRDLNPPANQNPYYKIRVNQHAL